MPVITSVKPQKSKRRVNVYLDGKFSFGLDLENFVKLKLKVGTELTQEEVKNVVKKAELQKVYEKVLRFASLRPRSKKEYESWLKKHKVHSSLFKPLFKRLKRLGFLDDAKFAQWWMEQRLQFKFKSKRELVSELRSKGIDKNIISKVLAENSVDEVKIAKKLLSKKRYRWERLDTFGKKRKMSEFLARKGFSWEVIRSVCNVDDED